MFFLLPIIQEIEADGWISPMCHLSEKKKLTTTMAQDIRCEICGAHNLDMDGYAKMMGVSKVTIKVIEKIEDYDGEDGQREKYMKGIKKYLSIIERPLFNNISNRELKKYLK